MPTNLLVRKPLDKLVVEAVGGQVHGASFEAGGAGAAARAYFASACFTACDTAPMSAMPASLALAAPITRPISPGPGARPSSGCRRGATRGSR